MFHEFPLATKVSPLARPTAEHLALDGCVVIGDVAFPNTRASEEAGSRCWDEEEHCREADEAIAARAAAGLASAYTQASRCGGVSVIRPVP